MIILVSAVLGLALTMAVRFAHRSHGGRDWARPLHWGALLAALAAAAAVWRTTWSDSGAIAFLLLGVPVVLAAASLAVPEGVRGRGIVVWLAGVVLFGWALLLGLGVGLVFVPAAILLLAAAAASRPVLREQPALGAAGSPHTSPR